MAATGYPAESISRDDALVKGFSEASLNISGDNLYLYRIRVESDGDMPIQNQEIYFKFGGTVSIVSIHRGCETDRWKSPLFPFSQNTKQFLNIGIHNSVQEVGE